MAEAFKNLINHSTVVHASDHLYRSWPGFDRTAFTGIASAHLERLEFKARAMQVAAALEATLPGDFGQAADVLERALAPPLAVDAAGEPVGMGSALSQQGLSGWVLWGAGEFVARRGMSDVPRALRCLHGLTQRFTAEFAIRPFIDQRPDEVFAVLRQWLDDPSPHVRRLVSEGSRPRLPWGLRLQKLVADPAPNWPLLLALQDDASAYVRRSVANHLNDIAKDHPDRVAQWVHTQLQAAPPERRALLRHASRGLIKQGHAPTLTAWGLGQGFAGKALLTLNPATAAIGESVVLQVDLESDQDRPQALVIDYLVHHVRANGRTSPKVFKGWTFSLEGRAARTLTKRHSLRPVSTRQLYPGRHRVALQINGAVCATAWFDLVASDL
jgi:3-methyladenine DNA glycosylase AlkC